MIENGRSSVEIGSFCKNGRSSDGNRAVKRPAVGHLRVRRLIILTQFLDDSIPWCHTCKYVQPNEPGVGCAYVQYNNVDHYYGLGEGTMDRSVLKLYAVKGPAVVVNIWSMDPLVRRLSLW